MDDVDRFVCGTRNGRGVLAAEKASDGAIAIDLTLSMAIDSARLETVSLDVEAAADSDGVPGLGLDLAAAFASGQTVVLDLGGVATMD